MPKNWKTYKLKDVCDKIYSGGTPKTSVLEYWNGDINWLSSGETSQRYINTTDKFITELGLEKSSARLARKGDTVIASAGQGKTRGQTSYLNIDTTLNQSVICLRADNNLIDSKFLFFNLTSRYNEFRNISDSFSTRGSLTKDLLGNHIILNLPPLPEQKAIANILSAIDDKIENNLAINKTLEEMAMAIYKHWFVDFGPFQEGEFVDSELGKIPKGWEVKNIYDLIEVIYGAPFKSKLFNQEKIGYPLIRIRDLKSGKPQFFTVENHKKKTIINKGDVLAGMDALFTPYIWSGQKAVLNQRVVFFKPKYDYVTNGFIYESIKPLLNYFERAKVGTTVIHLSKSDIDTFKFTFPKDKGIIENFNTQIESFHKQKVNNYTEIETLTKLRDTLLPKLISGEIHLKEFQEKIASVV